jgi:hypothetical protein
MMATTPNPSHQPISRTCMNHSLTGRISATSTFNSRSDTDGIIKLNNEEQMKLWRYLNGRVS